MMSLYHFVLGIQGNSTVKLSTSSKMALRCEMPVTKQTVYLWCLYLMLALILYWGPWALVPYSPCKCPASSCCFQLLISEVSSLQMCTAEHRVVADQLFASAICRPWYTGREGSLCAMCNTFSPSTIPFFWCPVARPGCILVSVVNLQIVGMFISACLICMYWKQCLLFSFCLCTLCRHVMKLKKTVTYDFRYYQNLWRCCYCTVL